MGIEGQKSPRDVASENEKHPWEIFPEDEASAIEKSEKKREKLTKKKNRREKRKARANSAKLWVKNHKIIVLIITIIVILLISAGIFAFFKWREAEIAKQAPEQDDEPEALIMYGYPEDFTIDDALTSQHAFSYANDIVYKIAMEGVDEKDPNALIIEDNLDAYIKTLKTEEEKVYFEIYKIYLLSYYDSERAKFLFDLFEERNLELTRKQRYAYLMAKAMYASSTDDSEAEQEYYKKIREEFADESLVIVDRETGEIIEDEELINSLKAGGWGKTE